MLFMFSANRRQQYVMYRSVPNVASAAGEMYNSVEAFFVMRSVVFSIISDFLCHKVSGIFLYE